MKRFTILLSLVGVLALAAVFQVWSEARAEAAKSVAISPVYDATGVMLEAIKPKAVTYQALLGKSLEDQNIADFIASNNCSGAAQFQLCRPAGVVLWMDSDQKVNSVFLYSGNADGFTTYKGQLPFGLTFTDTMEMVEQKLGHPVEIHAPQAGWVPGLPDESGTLDHIQYFATYKQFGVTIIYNSPSANDKNASIHSILVSE